MTTELAAPAVRSPRLATATSRIALTPVTDAAVWDALVARAPDPHLPQSFAYGEGKRAQGWQVERLVFMRGDTAVALVTVLSKGLLGLPLIHRINRGPLLLLAAPTQADLVAIYRALRNHCGRLWTGPLSIAPALPAGAETDELLHAAGYRRRTDMAWQSGRIDLTRTPDAILSGMGSTFRNRLRAAQRSGATLRIARDDATFAWMRERHVENMQAKGFRAVDARFLNAMRAAAPDAIDIYQMLRDDIPIAGMSVVRFGSVAEYHTGWFGPEGRAVNAGNFLMWSILMDARDKGATQFDIGGLWPGHGYTQFKQTMRPRTYALTGEWMSF